MLGLGQRSVLGFAGGYAHLVPQSAGGRRQTGSWRYCTRGTYDGAAWQPLLFLELCRDSEGSEGIAEARCFCQAMMNLEWRLLLEHSWALS